ncbi:MAG TPA: hypothetical protein VN231_06125 [Allosphingosinicella sp.]|nr:hypothetical protein [Allosphingosinicella sp.]
MNGSTPEPGQAVLASAPPRDGARFRDVLALVALIGGLLGLAGLFFIEVPEGNREPLLLALGLILGWGSTVIGYEFGSSPAGRRAAEAGLRREGEG